MFTLHTFSLAQTILHELDLMHKIVSADPMHYCGRRGERHWPFWASKAGLADCTPDETHFSFSDQGLNTEA